MRRARKGLGACIRKARPCSCRVARYRRMVQQTSAPALVRQPPEIFCLTLDMRSACPASWFVQRRPDWIMQRIGFTSMDFI